MNEHDSSHLYEYIKTILENELHDIFQVNHLIMNQRYLNVMSQVFEEKLNSYCL